VPTTHQRVCGEMVGTLRFAPPYDTGDFARRANQLPIFGISVKPTISENQKYSASLLPQIKGILRPSSPQDEGRSRSSRMRGGMRWTPRPRLTSVAEAYGEVVWFWRGGAGVKSEGSESVSWATEAKEPFSGESTK
jgi:hypothetical protein